MIHLPLRAAQQKQGGLMIAVEDLHKTYRDGVFFGKRVHALQGVSLTVERGEIFGLLGPNGAGKTTLIKILLGIVRKSGGTATLFGRPVGNYRVRGKVGYLPESHRIPQHLTGDTALEYYGGLSGLSVGEVRRRRPELLTTVGLSKWGKTSIRKYSKGMLQRLGLAQAMLHEPDLLILDEPTDGVDPVGRSEMRDVLKQLKDQGKTVFLNSHLLQEIELVCDRVAILEHGRVCRVGQVDELTEHAGAELVLTLQGDEAAIRGVLGSVPVISLDRIGGERIQVTAKVDEQTSVDACVDGLRQAGVSIYSLVRRRLTLEQAFLELIRNSDREA